MSSDGGASADARAAAIARVRRFVQSYVAKGRYGLYPDPAVVENVIERLADNLVARGRMYCPCAHVDWSDPESAAAAPVCPCPPHHEDIARQGYCDCALFASHDFVRAERRRGDDR